MTTAQLVLLFVFSGLVVGEAIQVAYIIQARRKVKRLEAEVRRLVNK